LIKIYIELYLNTITMSVSTIVVRHDKTVFNRIIQSNDVGLVISENTRNNIIRIASQVTSTGYERTPKFGSRSGHHNIDTNHTTHQPSNNFRNNSNNQYANRGKQHTSRSNGRSNQNSQIKEMSDQDWELLRKFEATKIANREGVDKSIQHINGLLNKLSDSTYNNILADVSKEVSDIWTNEANTSRIDDISKVTDALFNLASRNKFYTALYSKMSSDLIKAFPFIYDVFSSKFKDTKSIIADIEWCSSDEDYDQFCANNKKNEQRKALSSFYIHLMRYDIITIQDVVSTIVLFQNELTNGYDDKLKRQVNEEIAENIFILIDESIDRLIEQPEWDNIINHIKTCSNLNIKTHPGLSNKILFKFLDIVDRL